VTTRVDHRQHGDERTRLPGREERDEVRMLQARGHRPRTRFMRRSDAPSPRGDSGNETRLARYG